MAPFTVLGPDTPVTDAFMYNNMLWAGKVISFGAILGTAASTFTCMSGQIRIFLSMARDVRLSSLLYLLYRALYFQFSQEYLLLLEFPQKAALLLVHLFSSKRGHLIRNIVCSYRFLHANVFHCQYY